MVFMIMVFEKNGFHHQICLFSILYKQKSQKLSTNSINILSLISINKKLNGDKTID
jgi:hypothetical protein